MPARYGGLEFEKSNEPGDLALKGPRKGKPLPYGSAVLARYDEALFNEKWKWMMERLHMHIHELRRLGADDIVLHLTYWYEGQCNLSFEPEELKALSELNIPFTITCYAE